MRRVLLSACAIVFGLFAALLSGQAFAQIGTAVADTTLREPWVLEKAVVLTLPTLLAAIEDSAERAQIDVDLGRLDDGLTGYESQIDTVIDRLAGDPQFPYDAARVSFEMSVQIARIGASFEAIYRLLGVHQRADVRAAQASLDSLRKVLEEKAPFEGDVHRALGSGSRHEIVTLATRWWGAEEGAIAVRKAVAEVRRPLAAAPAGERRP